MHVFLPDAPQYMTCVFTVILRAAPGYAQSATASSTASAKTAGGPLHQKSFATGVPNDDVSTAAQELAEATALRLYAEFGYTADESLTIQEFKEFVQVGIGLS